MRMIHVLVATSIAALALACGDGGSKPTPKPAPTPTPAPTPKPAATPPAPPPSPKPSAPNAQAGSAHYGAFCATCHGASGKGDGAGAAGLPVEPRDFSKGSFKFDANGNGKPGDDDDLRLVIENGAAAYGGSALMTPWGGVLDEQAIADVIAYVRSLGQ